MSEQSPELELNTQLSQILSQLKSLSDRVAFIEDKLKLISDIDRYGKLQELLAAGKFKEADEETTNVILETVAKHRDTLTPNDMEKFPCNVLQVIDRLWRSYSQDRFGFSVQLAIYQEAGGNTDTLRAQKADIVQKFGDRVGWRINGEWQGDSYEQWNFSLSAPVGCFPAMWWWSPYGLKMATYCFLRLLACQL